MKLERKSQVKVCSVKDSWGGLQWDCLFYWNLDRFGFWGDTHNGFILGLRIV